MGGNDYYMQQQKNKSILYLFNSITEIVTNQLEEIIGTQGGIESNGDNENQNTTAGYITAKDFMNDFATEEFLSKNIRVRP